MSQSGFDWSAIAEYYAVGHTRAECQARFGFSNGAWNRAVSRGDINPRPQSSGLRASAKREQVVAMRAEGSSYVEIAKALGLTKSTVAYHARRAGIPAVDKFARRYDWAVVQEAVDAGASVRECVRRFGFSKDAWTKAVRRGELVPRPWIMPIEELLVRGRRTQRSHLKTRLLREGLKRNRCERCGIEDWRGQELAMQLHHVNGDGRDNRLENIEFLCPNCHAQTDTYGGRNGHRRGAQVPVRLVAAA